ncbi:MAG TPA: inner membrane CreD family protein [Acidobacteriota bacterium]|nr:inner membrane CreD family protein [Acidobacteriota bacterium]HQF88002.1 inner membrane CreD family protein [Acidobacteriota bacterium]HQG92188.1 inner membrane CreD family protein [Acidobacteriota bacterium]
MRPVFRILAIGLIFVATAVAWLALSGTIVYRTESQQDKLRHAVGQLWGSPQTQPAPEAGYTERVLREVTVWRDKQPVVEHKEDAVSHVLPLVGSDIKVRLAVDHRRKGLLWYATYRVQFEAAYRFRNTSAEAHDVWITFPFPAGDARLDNFRLAVAGRPVTEVPVTDGKIRARTRVAPGDEARLEVAYDSQGLDEWWYRFGEKVAQVRDFTLTMDTDFDGFDFPAGGISPAAKERRDGGWRLAWRFTNIFTDDRVGIGLPHRLNPGPWVAAVTAAAPVSLFLFFFLVLVLTTRRGINLHPMHYFFLAAAFFSFHLLLAYLVDHVDIHAAFAVCAAVSVLLVFTYMRLVAGVRFALVEVGVSQLVYQVGFSYTFFFEGYTGLVISALCVATLFATMQLTARLDWDEVFRRQA